MYFKIALLINAIVLSVLFSLSVLYYRAFEEAIDERTLNHLVSIKRLKRIQIENYINSKKRLLNELVHNRGLSSEDTFSVLPEDKQFDFDGVQLTIPETVTNEVQLVDISSKYNNEDHVLLYFMKQKDTCYTLISKLPSLAEILVERTGMGQTGETYIVGHDLLMRSKSRFLSANQSRNTKVKTEGVTNAMNSMSGTGVFKDYRGELVFSAFHKLKVPGLDWVILSEMDENEAHEPVIRLKKQLFIIAIIAGIIGLIASFILSLFLTKPIKQIKDQLNTMAKGILPDYNPPKSQFDEFNQVNDALKSLVDSMNSISSFAETIGNLKTAKYSLRSNEDVLGKALLDMQEKLKEYRIREKELQLLNQKTLWKGQDMERARLSKELHDGIGPLLTALKLAFQNEVLAEEQKVKLNDLVDATIQEVRQISHSLMPQAIFDFGVEAALKNFINTLKNATGANIGFSFSNDDELTLEEDLNITLYRVAQESVNNGLKHAKANKIHVDITVFSNEVHFYYKDDGVGFDLNTKSNGNGLLNMKERCRIMGGEFLLTSNTKGTSIEVTFPIQDD